MSSSATIVTLHGLRRVIESTDPNHFPWAAAFSAELRGGVFDLGNDEFPLLHHACEGNIDLERGMGVVKRKRLVEAAIVLFIILPLMALIWLPILTSEIKPWETGSPIPVEPPSEDRRIVNDAGFSIVSPPNWTVRNANGLLHMRPKQVIAGRSKAQIFVLLSEETPHDLHDTEIIEFQNQPAHRRVERRRSTFDDPALTAWTYYFQRSGKWIAVGYFIAEAHQQMPEMARLYLETLKVE